MENNNGKKDWHDDHWYAPATPKSIDCDLVGDLFSDMPVEVPYIKQYTGYDENGDLTYNTFSTTDLHEIHERGAKNIVRLNKVFKLGEKTTQKVSKNTRTQKIKNKGIQP